MLRFPWEREAPGTTSVIVEGDGIRFHRGERSMWVGAETHEDEVTIFTATIGRWDDDAVSLIPEWEREQVLLEMTRELEKKGLRIRLRVGE